MNAWILSIMLAILPPAPEDASRYESIADDVSAVVDSEGPFTGYSKHWTAVMLLAISFHESKWRADVDNGSVRGQGIDVCLVQIRPINGGREGWTTDEIVADRRKCLTLGLRIARRSFGACKANPLNDRLAAYASGKCHLGKIASREIVTMGRDWWHRYPRPKHD